jgi:hypothetical protein
MSNIYYYPNSSAKYRGQLVRESIDGRYKMFYNEHDEVDWDTPDYSYWTIAKLTQRRNMVIDTYYTAEQALAKFKELVIEEHVLRTVQISKDTYLLQDFDRKIFLLDKPYDPNNWEYNYERFYICKEEESDYVTLSVTFFCLYLKEHPPAPPMQPKQRKSRAKVAI